MKKILSLLLIIIFSISAVVYSSTFFIENSASELSTSLVEKQVEKQIYRIVDEINSIIPIVQDQQVDEVIRKIENDPRVSDTIDTYSQIFIKDLVNDESNLAQNINQDVQTLLYTYTDDFSGLMGDVITPEYKNIIIEGVIEKIDFNDYYNSLRAEVDSRLSAKETKILKLVNFFYENLDSIRSTSLLLAISSFIFSLLLNISITGILWVLILQSFASLLTHLAAHFISIQIFIRYLSAYDLSVNYSLYVNIEIFFLVILIVSLVLKAINRKSEE